MQEWFAGKRDAMVALSGGVDSALVAHAAHAVLGPAALAVTADYRTLAAEELESAVSVASQIGIRHRTIRYDELDDERFARNDRLRCYHCRTQLGDRLAALARELGHTLVVDGTNADDVGDYRPGIAAMRERGARSPLLEAGITKGRVREMAREAGLAVHDRPSNSCLASRIPWGSRVTAERLARIEMGERYVRNSVPRGSLRVRDVDGVARIEVERGMAPRLRRSMPEVEAALRRLGFAGAEISPGGYVQGGANTP